MTAKATTAKATVAPQADAPASHAPQEPAADAALSVKKILAAVNDGADDPDTVKALNEALYRFGAQDPSLELPRSWQRVQRRIGLDPGKPNQDRLDGVATVDEVARFAARVGLTVTN